MRGKCENEGMKNIVSVGGGGGGHVLYEGGCTGSWVVFLGVHDFTQTVLIW